MPKLTIVTEDGERTAAEYAVLTARGLYGKVRLACQLVCKPGPARASIDDERQSGLAQHRSRPGTVRHPRSELAPASAARVGGRAGRGRASADSGPAPIRTGAQQ